MVQVAQRSPLRSLELTLNSCASHASRPLFTTDTRCCGLLALSTGKLSIRFTTA